MFTISTMFQLGVLRQEEEKTVTKEWLADLSHTVIFVLVVDPDDWDRIKTVWVRFLPGWTKFNWNASLY